MEKVAQVAVGIEKGQDLLENGTVSPLGAKDGWLNRALAFHGGSKRAGLAVGQTVPLILRGDVPVAAWAPRGLPRVEDDFLIRHAGPARPVPRLTVGRLGDSAGFVLG